ncbi:phosphoenolpyruvate synthase [Novosphingobium pentaromativorans]|uniref:Phosphoenolpyruvate synthase n=1 Tax=Novosphingobium pentaromativorans US6-1 TaxID=1088721 RepID=G6E6X0_9SPHN|nr:phosphoenolpyruvate synthase [Novosphingobium pentaromativorans]AIT78390.1 phosphoenolpyruvate synthase [Novosphingobium pentaromativorans US6-1]EHJ63016.1 phosphoenolpyruvate synthase [Novosphingobium pentaromativorans US6-1]
MATKSTDQQILWYDEIAIGDIPSVGGKNASLGELLRELGKAGVRVPNGFATTARAFRDFIDVSAIEPKMREHIRRYRAGDETLQDAGHTIRELVLASQLPTAFADQIRAAYRKLAETTETVDPPVAVRSSATAEDLPDASFAGQHETYLNVRGEQALLDACLRCFASLFTDRAISYREAKGFDHFAVALSVGVQQMVRSDLAGSGVMFTIDTESGFPGIATISAAWGLGETIVQGTVNPDRYVVFKPLLGTPGARPIIEKALGDKAIRMIYAEEGGRQTRIIPAKPTERQSFVLNDDEILELGRWAVAVERHYGRPMDLEWAKDGSNGLLYLVQARPETIHGDASHSGFRHYSIRTKADPVLSGVAIGSAIASGKVCLIRDAADIAHFQDGAILVTGNTDPDWVPIMKRAAGIVTDRGGSTSHAAIVSRELGVPAVVGTSMATSTLHDGQDITLSCASGDKGLIFKGLLDYVVEDIDLSAIPETRTEVMLNIADPAAAFQWWRLPAKGVGLARMEFIINNLIKVHPMALLHLDRVSASDNRHIRQLVKGHASPADYFVETLARGVGRLAAPFFPHPAIVRLSDFKTNEYAHLVGGDAFEPSEENPMLGFRGASRYYDERYRDGFALECRALRSVREDMGFANVVVMVPFCRTPAEADRVLAAMAENGLRRGENGLQVYMMCEIPSNVILAEEFARRFDGFSIGSNDLTQLLLGVDRDSELLAAMFDERDPAVTQAIAEAIRKAHGAGIKIGICGQAPSNYPDFAEFLVREGIDSISLNPDSFVKTCSVIAAAEASAA